MSVAFLDHGDHYYLRLEDNRNKADHLPPGIYRLRVIEGPTGVSILFEKDNKLFPLPQRRFGRHESIASTVVQDHDMLNPPMGLIAMGVKGSGKSILCEDIANRLLQKGLPIIMVTSAVSSAILHSVSQAIGPAVFYFDEIGKIYRPMLGQDGPSNSALNELLPFFSNQALVGTVFLITANECSELNEYFIDRPGRFKYRIDMSGLERAAYLEYMKCHNISPEKLIWLEGCWSNYTFDQLRVIVPVLHSSSTVDEFLDKTEIMNISKPRGCRIIVHSILRDGLPVVPEEEDFTRIMMEESDLVLHLGNESLRIPWRTSDGEVSEFIRTNCARKSLVGGCEYLVGASLNFAAIPSDDERFPGTLIHSTVINTSAHPPEVLMEQGKADSRPIPGAFTGAFHSASDSQPSPWNSNFDRGVR